MALLELDGLTRRFGGIVAVDGVTMRVEAGEVRAVIGPNGAGKSTLFKLVLGELQPDGGDLGLPRGARVASVDQEHPATAVSLLERTGQGADLAVVVGGPEDWAQVTGRALSRS